MLVDELERQVTTGSMVIPAPRLRDRLLGPRELGSAADFLSRLVVSTERSFRAVSWPTRRRSPPARACPSCSSTEDYSTIASGTPSSGR